MTERLIKIITLRDVNRFAGMSISKGTARTLKRRGFEVEGLNHYLIHYPDLQLNEKEQEWYITHILDRCGGTGSWSFETSERQMNELKDMIKIYAKEKYYQAPCFALTSPERYPLVGHLFQDLGWKVERLLAKK